MNERGWLTGCGVSRTAADWGRMGLVVLAVIACAWPSGCSRQRYRLQADRDVYEIVAGKSFDPRWALPQYTIEMDSRSRYFDPYDPDRQPMPVDDPASTPVHAPGQRDARLPVLAQERQPVRAGKPSLVRSTGGDRSHE